MNKVAVIRTLRSWPVWASTVLTGLVICGAVVESTPASIILSALSAAATVALVAFTYLMAVDRQKREAEWRAEDEARARRRYEFDLEMEQRDREREIVNAGGPEAEKILDRWKAEREVQEAREREERRKRIAEYEAAHPEVTS